MGQGCLCIRCCHGWTVLCCAVLCCQAPSDEDEEDSDFQVVHGPVGDSSADLPPAAQKVLAALQYNQGQLDTLAAESQQQRNKLKAEQSKLRAKLAAERRWVGFMMWGCNCRVKQLPSAVAHPLVASVVEGSGHSNAPRHMCMPASSRLTAVSVLAVEATQNCS